MIAAGTRITLDSADTRPVEEIELGMPVLTVKAKSQRVTRISRRKYTGRMIAIYTRNSASPLRITPEHPVMVLANIACEPQWKQAKHVLDTDYVWMAATERPRPVVSVHSYDVRNLDVFNVEAWKDLTYVANGIAVHQ